MKILLQPTNVVEFSQVSSSTREPFALITGSNLDDRMPNHSSEKRQEYLLAYTAILEHHHLVGWYGSNCVLQQSKRKALPLGPKWQWHGTAFQGEDITKSLVSRLLRPLCTGCQFELLRHIEKPSRVHEHEQGLIRHSHVCSLARFKAKSSTSDARHISSCLA